MENQIKKSGDIIKNLINQKINGTQASKQLNLSVRQTKRINAKVLKIQKEGGEMIKGVIHGSRGKESKKRISQKDKDRIIKLRKTKDYYDFTPALFQEKLEKNYEIKYSYGTIRNILVENKLYKVKSRKINKKHFSQRERKNYYGELIQFDGSYHNWLENRCIDKKMKKGQCLLVAIDDATGELTPLLAKNEGIKAVFQFWKSYLKTKGKPIAIYLDKVQHLQGKP